MSLWLVTKEKGEGGIEDVVNGVVLISAKFENPKKTKLIQIAPVFIDQRIPWHCAHVYFEISRMKHILQLFNKNIDSSW